MNASEFEGTSMSRGARRAVSQADVDAAASAIVASGGRASVRAVRDRLGSGSFSTIAPKLASWRQAHEMGTESDPASHLPIGVVRSMQSAIDDGVERVANRLQADLEEAHQATRLAMAELNEVKDRLSASEAVVGALQKANAQLKRDLEEALEQHRLDHDTLMIDYQAAVSRAVAAETRVSQLDERLA
jgi:hypothetical protein